MGRAASRGGAVLALALLLVATPSSAGPSSAAPPAAAPPAAPASLAEGDWAARAASARASLADLRQRMETADREDRERVAAATRERQKLLRALDAGDLAPAVETFHGASAEVDAEGARLVRELARARSGDDAVAHIPGWPGAADVPADLARERELLERERALLDRDLRAAALAAARRAEAAAVDANALRVRALAASPDPTDLTSPRTDGWAQARLEGLLLRRRLLLRVEEARSFVGDASARLRDPATSFRLLALAVEIALGVAGLRLVRGGIGLLARRPERAPTLRRGALERFREVTADVARVAQRPLAIFLGLWLLRWLLGPDGEGPFVSAVLGGCLWISGALSVAAIAGGVFEGASDWAEDDEEPEARRAPSDVETTRLAESGVRALRRAALAASIWLAASQAIEAWVGDGVLAAWLDSLALVAAPLLVAWVAFSMRAEVASRLDRLARENPDSRLLAWVARNKTRVWRFVPLTVGVLAVAAWAIAAWAVEQVSSFDASRRALAWAFRRRVEARADGQERCAPLDDASAVTFRPEGPPLRALARVDREVVDRLGEAVREGRGGIFAIVGERGLGKSAILARISQAVGDAPVLTAVVRRGGDPVADVRAELHADLGTSTEELAERIEDSPYVAVLLDDVHRAVAPRVGGLDALDALVALARLSSKNTLWVLTFERTSWEFVARARESEPIFDEVFLLDPWTEADIAQLVRTRTALARLRPSFADLVGATPTALRGPGAQRAETDFYRMLWDQSLGNPAVALLLWRASLVVDAAGAARVRLFAAPDPDDLEGLPDDARFVLRALVQLEHAAPSEIQRATLLDAREVLSALRNAAHRGLVEPVPGDGEGRLRLSWAHYRAVTRFLRRKHLLTTV